MNKFILLAITLITSLLYKNANAQSNVGIGTTNPNPKALLELQSTDKGFLIPRVTTTERTAIAPSGLGDRALLVYDTDDNLFYFWDGTQWVGFPQQNSGSNNISLNFDVNTGTLSLTDAGGTLTTNIPPDNDSDPANELITNVVFGTGNILTIDEGGNTWSTTINVNDADSDPTNEFNTNFTFNNTTNTLAITDAGSTLNVDLSSLNDTYSAGTGINISGNVISNTGDLSNTNELITNISLNAATGVLTITEGGNNNTVNLSSFGNDWKLTGNAGTNPATNFLGTTDNQDLVFRTNNSEKVRILSGGNVGININNPAARLHLFSNAGTVGDPAANLLQLTNGTFSWTVRVGSGNGWLAWVPDAALTRRWQINNGAGDVIFNVNVGAPENSFFMGTSGFIEFGLGAGQTRRINLPNIAANDGRGRAETWETYSDSRIKSNQQTISYGLKEVLKMQPKEYLQHNSLFRENSIDILPQKNRNIGFIAQEMYQIIPEAVFKPENESLDLWSMSYEKLVPVLVKAIQEQQEIIETLKTDNITAKNELSEIKQLLIDTRTTTAKQ